jgi:hypothetical protein
MIIDMTRPDHDSGPSAVSLAALRLHARALLFSFEDGHGGFVPDDYVTGFGPNAADAARELCGVGVWQRAGGGYEVASSEALRMAYEVHRAAGDFHGRRKRG